MFITLFPGFSFLEIQHHLVCLVTASQAILVRVTRGDRIVESCKPGVNHYRAFMSNIDPYGIIRLKSRQQFLSMS